MKDSEWDELYLVCPVDQYDLLWFFKEWCPVLTLMSPCFCCFPVTNVAAKVGELEDSIREVYQHSKDNRKEIGRLEGIRVVFPYVSLLQPAAELPLK